MELFFYVLLAVAGLWIVWKILGGIATVVTNPQMKRHRDSAAGRAILAAVQATGSFDGSEDARQRARDAFIDVATHPPFDEALGMSTVKVEELASTFASRMTRQDGPILLEAAYLASIIFGHDEDLRAVSKEDRQSDEWAVLLFVALFEQWAKRHQVGTPGALKQQQSRYALIIWSLLDRATRMGLLPNDTRAER